MEHIETIPGDELRAALDNVDGKKPAQRLITAIAYKNGVTQTELAGWYGVERRTIYSWLKRLDRDSLERSATDAHRPGRPRKLSENELEELGQRLRRPPTEAGYDRTTWTPELVRRHLGKTYDVAYSVPSCRRLMKEAGLRYRDPPRTDREDGEHDGENARERDGIWVPQ
jgi:transposase